MFVLSGTFESALLFDHKFTNITCENLILYLISQFLYFQDESHACYSLLVHCRDPSALAYAIKRSCENKAEVVSLDEKESGLRATLNLGHTFGHVSILLVLFYM